MKVKPTIYHHKLHYCGFWINFTKISSGICIDNGGETWISGLRYYEFQGIVQKARESNKG